MRKLEHIVEPESLLLSWQEPVGRMRYVVGRIAREGGGVCFRYMPGKDLTAAKFKGFKGYTAFPHFDSEYRLGVMESFMTRLPPRSREDFGKFLEYWHIDRNLKDSISDFALLGYTGAVLPRDGFRIIPVFPEREHLELIVEVAGHHYHATNSCQMGESVSFITEPANEFDPMAVLVVGSDGQKLGYIIRGISPQFVAWIQAGQLHGEIVRVNGTTDRPVILVYVEFDRRVEKISLSI